MSTHIWFDEPSILRRLFLELPDTAEVDGAHRIALRQFLTLFFRILEEEKDAVPAVLIPGKDPADPLCPAELMEQEASLEQILKDLGIPILRTGARALDAMQAVMEEENKAGCAVLPVTASPLLLQLIQDGQDAVLIQKENGTFVPVRCNAGKVKELFGILPEQIPDFSALRQAAGPHTAVRLLSRFGSAKEAVKNCSGISGTHLRESLQALSTSEDPSAAFRPKKMDGISLPAMEDAFDADAAGKKVQEMLSESSGSAEPAAEERIIRTREEADSAFDELEAVLQEGGTIAVVPISDPRKYGRTGPLLGIAAALSPKKSFFIPVTGTDGEDGGALPEGQLSLFDLPGKQTEEDLVTERFLTDHLRTLRLAAQSGKAAAIAVFDLKSQFPFWGIQDGEFDDGIRLHGFVDCLIGAYLLNPLKSDYAPEDIASEYSGDMLPSKKDLLEKKTFAEKLHESERTVSDYAQHEARVLLSASPKILAKLKKEGMADLYESIELPLSWILYDMQRIGIRIVPDRLREYGDHLVGRIGELEQKIHEETGDPDFNISSPRQLGEVLFEKMHLEGGKKTKSGWSTSADILEKLAPDHPVVSDILEYRALTKLKSTYADGLAEYIAPDSRIHTTFNQTITATGRISSTDPNLQNIPMRTELGRKIRKVFIPEDGWSFTDSDYSQIELRILASMSGDEALIEAYQGGKDIHRMTASKVFNTPFDEVTDLQRRNAKAVNFGIVYGISSFGLSQGLSISRKEAAAYIDQYFKMFPGIKTFLDKQVADAKANGYSVTMMGRRRPIPELKESNFMRRQFGERVAMNAPIQGTGADIMKKAMIRVWEMLHKKHLKSRLILQIHDELLIETAPGEEQEVEQILKEGMMGAADLKVALEVDCHNGSDWYEAK